MRVVGVDILCDVSGTIVMNMFIFRVYVMFAWRIRLSVLPSFLFPLVRVGN